MENGFVKGLGFLGKHSMNIFLIHSFYRDVFFHEFTYSFYYAWLDYIVLTAISLVTSIVLEWFKKLIRYEKFIDWVKKISNKRRSNSTLKKEKKSSIFWILIIFFVLFSIWQLWVPEALDDWRWGSEVGIMRLKRGLKDIMDVTLEIFWSLF